MHIALLRAAVEIPASFSLKDKRRVLRSIKDRTSRKMNVSVAEVGQHDIWNRAELAFVTVAENKDVIDKRLAALLRLLEENAGWVLNEVKTEAL